MGLWRAPLALAVAQVACLYDAASGFDFCLMRTASRPLYQPQFGQAWWDRFG